MNYLLVNHVPFGVSTAHDRYLVGDLWLEDLRAQAEAWSPYGRLIVTVPYTAGLSPKESGSFNLVEINLAEENFDFVPLPYYQNWKSFVQTLPELRHRLRQICQEVAIVQADYGGHPLPLGQVVWPIAGELGRKRIWVFDGADPFPRMNQSVQQESNLLKRVVKGKLVQRFERFCRRAIAEADLVFSHNASVRTRFKNLWNQHCHSFNRSFVKPSMLIDDKQLQSRRTHILDRSQPLRLVTAGRQIAIKGTDHILRSMALAIEQGANLELTVIGEGDDLATYQDLARTLGMNDRVRFVGAVPYGQSLFELMQQAHVLLITNLTAEISRNVLLGMALGLPLILYRNPGTDRLIEQHDAGTLVPLGDMAALAQALVAADRDRSRLAQLMTNGVKVAQAQTIEMTHIHRARLAASCIDAPMLQFSSI
jgi:glycosyltransferase involved in cell wall biosynthesis